MGELILAMLLVPFLLFGLEEVDEEEAVGVAISLGGCVPDDIDADEDDDT